MEGKKLGTYNYKMQIPPKMAKYIPEFIKEKIFVYRKIKTTFRDIADKLIVPKSTCQRIWNEYEKKGKIHRKNGSGRSKLLSEDAQEYLQSLAIRNPKLTATELIKVINRVY